MSRRTPRSASLLPILVLALVLLAWDLVVRGFAIPPYILPGPGAGVGTLIVDWPLLWEFAAGDAVTTVEGFVLAAVGGVVLAILFNQSRLVEYSFYPFAVILQVTPIVAIAPLLLIYLPQHAAVLACAWIVAFFPVLANTTLGLNSVDHISAALFDLSRRVALAGVGETEVAIGAALHAGGLKIAGGLSLIGAVVAEIAAGSRAQVRALPIVSRRSGCRPQHPGAAARGLACCRRSPALRSSFAGCRRSRIFALR